MITFWAGWIVAAWLYGRGAILPSGVVSAALWIKAGVIIWGAL